MTADETPGVKNHKDGSRPLFETMCWDEEACQKIINSEIKVNHHGFYPVRSLLMDAEIVTLRVSEDPHDISRKETEESLCIHLSEYGEVLDVCLYTERCGDFFLGSGMTVLNRSGCPSTNGGTTKKLSDLQHEIPWHGEEPLRVTWDRMSLHCRYCHKEGHARLQCPNRPGAECWNWGQSDHLNAQCPHGHRSANRKKARNADSESFPVPAADVNLPDSVTAPTLDSDSYSHCCS